MSTRATRPTTELKPLQRFSSFDLDSWAPAVDVAYRVELVDDSGGVVTQFETTFVDCP